MATTQIEAMLTEAMDRYWSAEGGTLGGVKAVLEFALAPKKSPQSAVAGAVDFQIDPDTLTLADGAQITAALTVDIESDAEGSYFEVTGLRWENCRVDREDWRWIAVAEWVRNNALQPFGIVREAHAKRTGGEARADDLGCHLFHQSRAA